jgi:hypothetical protein
MQNVALIALVLVIVILGAYQYKPSLFRFMNRYEGFEGAASSGDKPMGQPLANPTSAQPPGPGASPGSVTEMLNSAVASMAKGDMGGDPESKGTMGNDLKNQPKEKEKSSQGFADLSSFEGPANFGGAEAPAGCYPRDQLTPAELLPKDMNSIWAEQNPMGPGSLKGKNFLSAGALIGVNTVGQSLRNANLQIRSEPPNPQVPVSIFLQSTIGPDISHRTLEIN